MKKRTKTGPNLLLMIFTINVNKALKYKFFQLKVQNFIFLLNGIENKTLKSICIFLNFTPVLRIIVVGWLVVLEFNATLTAKVISWRSVTYMCFLAFSHQY